MKNKVRCRGTERDMERGGSRLGEEGRGGGKRLERDRERERDEE